MLKVSLQEHRAISILCLFRKTIGWQRVKNIVYSLPRFDKCDSPFVIHLPATAASPTCTIVQSLTQDIAAHRLPPGTKLVEQKLADRFGVSRTLVRQALFQLAQSRLITLLPARGAFIASPSVEEARQVFAVRHMLEMEMTRAFAREATSERIAILREHMHCEEAAVHSDEHSLRGQLLGDFHVRMAEALGNRVLAETLGDLISRCALITLMYQSADAAGHSHEEHIAIVQALETRDEEAAVALMQAHLQHVQEGLIFEPSQLTQPTAPPRRGCTHRARKAHAA